MLSTLPVAKFRVRAILMVRAPLGGCFSGVGIAHVSTDVLSISESAIFIEVILPELALAKAQPLFSFSASLNPFCFECILKGPSPKPVAAFVSSFRASQSFLLIAFLVDPNNERGS